MVTMPPCHRPAMPSCHHFTRSIPQQLVVVDSIALPPPPSADADAAAAHVASWRDTYTKLQIWTLDQPTRGGYEAVVYGKLTYSAGCCASLRCYATS